MPSKSPRSLRLALLLLSGSALAGVPFVTAAQAGNWTGATSTDWFTNTNWDTNAVPTNADDTVIDTTTVNSTIIDTNAASASTLTVGESGTGSLTITGGGSLQSGIVTLGDASGSSGSITVENGSNLVATTLNIGVAGGASFTVQNGGSVLDGAALVGSTNGTASATLDGATSTWNSNDLIVGAPSSHGSVTVQNGGTLISVTGEVGQLLGTGTVTLTDTGSHWAVDTLVVGEDGTGTVTVENGATLSGTTLTIAGNPGTVHAPGTGTLAISTGGVVTTALDATIGALQNYTGTVTVDGAGSGWTVGGARLVIGDQGGTGNLSITSAGVVSAVNVIVGVTAGSTGTVTIDGTHSAFLASGEMDIGQAGTGTLHLQNGAGMVAGTYLEIGQSAGGTGTMTMDGAGTTMVVGASAYVGDAGNGTLTISNGAVLNAADFVVGNLVGATGTATITGTGSEVTATSFVDVGYDGNGTLNLQNGAQLAAGGAFSIGDRQGTGTVTVDASEIFASSFLNIGGEFSAATGGTGTLAITNGGTVSALFIELGQGVGSSGTVTVDGVNSSLASSDDIGVGVDGNGTLKVSNGASLSAGELDVGKNAGSSGAVILTDPGTSAQINSDVVIGGGGTGSLSIANGAILADFTGFVGSNASGTATVDGAGSAWNTRTDLEIGQSADGIVTISHGGAVSAGDTFLGDQPGVSGTVIVTDAGSSFTGGGDLFLGSSGAATMLVKNGGVASAAGDTHIGSQQGATGSLTIDGAGSRFDGAGLLLIGEDGQGTLTIANGAVASFGGAVTIAEDAGSSGALNIGAGPSGAAVAPGTLDVTNVAFGDGAGSINFNHTSSNYTFAPSITGNGTINQIAGTTFLSADSSGFTGATNVSGGALHVNGSLKNSTVTVMNGGTLAGNGTVGKVVAQAGGTVAPGNSIGTLTVNGDYNQASGSTYQAQIASNGQADRLNISGAATIANGALLSVVKTDAGPYLSGTQYTVLTAAGGVTGTFTLTGDAAQTAFSSLSATYDAHDVYLVVGKTASFAAAGATPNQRAAAGGADSLPQGNALYQALLGLPNNSAAQGAFDAISGEIHASIRTAALEDSRFVREAAVDRLRDADGERGIWAKGFGDWGVDATDGNAAKLSRSTGGILAGADGVFGTWRAGVLAGYSHSDTDVAARASSGDSDNYHLGVYGGTAQGPLGIRFGAAYSWQDIAVSRSAGFAGFSDKLASSYDAGTAQVFGDIGYRIQTPSLALEPFADLAYVNLDSGAFSESGGVSALAGHSQTSDATFTTLGARGSMGVNLGTALATAHGSLGWRHAFGDITPRSSFAFAGSTAFTIAGVPLAEDAAAIEAGIDMAVSDHASVGLSYSGQLSQRAEDHGVQAMANWKF